MNISDNRNYNYKNIIYIYSHIPYFLKTWQQKFEEYLVKICSKALGVFLGSTLLVYRHINGN